ncbi:hypothetical protein AVEN_72705-1 [Araneus ventricosus]|uniref:Uncharacterized protein n=1 Tax=Araneus ventricosus TaxID=182803 RepID=A0A4Y2W7H6_ARAVE|nr:hypothetical protein AVEN_72705-1 [Araneus ventricosus]
MQVGIDVPGASLKQVIHRSSKRVFLENGKEKPVVKVENPSNLEQMIQNGGIQKNLKSKTQSADSNLRPRYARVAAKQRIYLHWHLASRLEMKFKIPRVGEVESGWQEICDFEPCLKTNFGTSVNALPNFSTKVGGKKTGLKPAVHLYSIPYNCPNTFFSTHSSRKIRHIHSSEVPK